MHFIISSLANKRGICQSTVNGMTKNGIGNHLTSSYPLHLNAPSANPGNNDTFVFQSIKSVGQVTRTDVSVNANQKWAICLRHTLWFVSAE